MGISGEVGFAADVMSAAEFSAAVAADYFASTRSSMHCAPPLSQRRATMRTCKTDGTAIR